MDIKATTLNELIPLLVTRISTTTGIAEEYIVPTLAERHFQPGGYADKYVLISNFSGTEYPEETTGGGVAAKWWDCILDVTLVARLDIDLVGHDLQRLVNASLGLLPEWRLLLKGLDQWFPTSGGQGLLLQPARTNGFAISPRDFQSTNGWVQIRTRLHMPFVQDMS